MATIRDQILDAMVAALNASAPVGVPTAVRRRMRPYDLAALGSSGAIDVAPENETVQTAGGQFGPLAKRAMTVAVRCWAVNDAPEKITDPMVAWITQALVGNTLGGLALVIAEDSYEWAYEAADTIYGVATVKLQVLYRTAAANQEAVQ